MTTEQELKNRDFDAWCEPEFYKVLEKEVARLERGALPYSDKQIGDMLGCTKSEATTSAADTTSPTAWVVWQTAARTSSSATIARNGIS